MCKQNRSTFSNFYTLLLSYVVGYQKKKKCLLIHLIFNSQKKITIDSPQNVHIDL